MSRNHLNLAICVTILYARKTLGWDDIAIDLVRKRSEKKNKVERKFAKCQTESKIIWRIGHIWYLLNFPVPLRVDDWLEIFGPHNLLSCCRQAITRFKYWLRYVICYCIFSCSFVWNSVHISKCVLRSSVRVGFVWASSPCNGPSEKNSDANTHTNKHIDGASAKVI